MLEKCPDGAAGKTSDTPIKPAQEPSDKAAPGPGLETGPQAQHRLAEMRHDPEVVRRAFETGEYPYHTKMGTAAYEKRKAKLQAELLKVQRWVKDAGVKIVVLFEGRDAAGKGGTIKRFMEHMNPRGARVVALEKPSEEERGQWYFQRYIKNLPTAGEIVLFDRSWYNRAGVERVMGFCSPNEYLEFMRQTPEVERMLTRSGIKLFKYWFSITRDEQLQRFKSERSIRSNSGSSRPSTWRRCSNGMNTPRPRKRCFSIPIPPTHRGPSLSLTIRKELASTACSTFYGRYPTRTRI